MLSCNDELLPIEIKWTNTPSFRDAKHLDLFLKEYPKAKKGYVVCQTSKNQILSNNIEAISWKDLIKKLHDW